MTRRVALKEQDLDNSWWHRQQLVSSCRPGRSLVDASRNWTKGKCGRTQVLRTRWAGQEVGQATAWWTCRCLKVHISICDLGLMTYSRPSKLVLLRLLPQLERVQESCSTDLLKGRFFSVMYGWRQRLSCSPQQGAPVKSQKGESQLCLEASIVAQKVKNLPAVQETWVRKDPWVRKMPWRREWLPSRVFLPGEFHGQRNWGCKELDTAKRLTHTPALAVREFMGPKQRSFRGETLPYGWIISEAVGSLEE